MPWLFTSDLCQTSVRSKSLKTHPFTTRKHVVGRVRQWSVRWLASAAKAANQFGAALSRALPGDRPALDSESEDLSGPGIPPRFDSRVASRLKRLSAVVKARVGTFECRTGVTA